MWAAPRPQARSIDIFVERYIMNLEVRELLLMFFKRTANLEGTMLKLKGASRHKVVDSERKEQKIENEQKQPRMYSCARDIVAYFNRKPEFLYAYVKMGYDRNLSILVPHILQLAKKADMKLMLPGGSEVTNCLEEFINPRRFSNMEMILDRTFGIRDAPAANHAMKIA
jgi:hypothetical protein